MTLRSLARRLLGPHPVHAPLGSTPTPQPNFHCNTSSTCTRASLRTVEATIKTTLLGVEAALQILQYVDTCSTSTSVPISLPSSAPDYPTTNSTLINHLSHCPCSVDLLQYQSSRTSIRNPHFLLLLESSATGSSCNHSNNRRRPLQLVRPLYLGKSSTVHTTDLQFPSRWRRCCRCYTGVLLPVPRIVRAGQ